ncbi:MAG: MotA/TolQ/ExbB proton channel family protein [Muribaculaceae bacterium]|nr:MotA/TolQ/ExbB proton channel family protein [Muribaculaceae bacterium]
MSLWSLVLDGGYIMIPLAVLLLIALYIFIERTIALHRASRIDSTFMKRIRDYVLEGDIENAVQLCKRTDSPYARLILKGVNRIGRPMNDVLVAIENTGNIEVSKLEKGFTMLSTTAAGAPMLGFLGTVTGMIEAFYSLASAGKSADVTLLSSGIYQALVTTVAGLVVGIVALFAYNYLVARVNRIMNGMEARTMEFMDLLNEPG